jgi:hypothetical protein
MAGKDMKLYEGDLDPSGNFPHGFGEYIYDDGSVYEVFMAYGISCESMLLSRFL